jgi:formylglycine-generating enzyme required for sulfatase activity
MRVWLACFVMTGCGLFPSLDDLTQKGDAAVVDVSVTDVTTGTDAGSEASAADASPDVTKTDGGCPGTAGPTMVPISGFCIDSTEVTYAQYKQFIAASFGSTGLAECAWNTTYVPTQKWPPAPGTDDYPVAYTNWCDAYAFCKWAGKRLCGRVGGGPNVVTSVANVSLDQWYAACSHEADGQHAYPYGNTFSPTACNGPERDAGATLPVGFLSTCTGGYSTMVDMVGNVYEWEDACGAATGASDSCVQRSGSFYDPPGSTQTCAYSRTALRNFADNDIGFRCCSP